LQPGQCSFPTNLPDSFLRFPVERFFLVPSSPTDPRVPKEWSDVEFTTLGPIISRDGAFGETVFLHKPIETLLVTDTVLEVSDDARDTTTQRADDTPETHRIGWRREVLFRLFFMPSSIDVKSSDVALKERRPDINPEFARIYLWDWVRDEMPSFTNPPKTDKSHRRNSHGSSRHTSPAIYCIPAPITKRRFRSWMPRECQKGCRNRWTPIFKR